MLGVEAVGDGFVGEDFPVAEDDVAFGVAGDVEFVGDHEDGDAGVVEFLEDAHDFDAGLAVEVAGGFVGEEEGGVVDEGAGDGDALLLAAGELVGVVVGAGCEADGLEGLEGAGAAGFGGVAVALVEEGEFDVFEGGGAGEEVEALEDESDFLVADVGEFVAVELGDVCAVEEVVAGGGAVEAADHVHEGGFAGAAGAHEGDEFAGLDVECDAADGVHIYLAGVVGLVDVGECDDRFHGQRLGIMPPPKGLLADGLAVLGDRVAVMALSPSSRPLRISVAVPSLMPVLMVMGLMRALSPSPMRR